MGMTLAEKILARKADRAKVQPGEIVEVDVDLASMNEITTELVFRQFERFKRPVWDKDKVTFSVCHFPASNVAQASNIKHIREFSKEQGIRGFFPQAGPLSEILVEQGYIIPNLLVMGTDSHTITDGAYGAFAAGIGSTEMVGILLTGRIWLRVPTTIKFTVSGQLGRGTMPKDLVLEMIRTIGSAGANYKAVEYAGETIDTMDMDGRKVLASMAAEMGAKVGLIAADETTVAEIRRRTDKPFDILQPDDDAEYEAVIPVDAGKVEPLVACPHNPGNVRFLSDVEPVKIHQGFIGTCTGGRLDDMRAAARVLKGKRVHPDVQLVIIPATPEIYKHTLEEGLINVFVDAGAIVEFGNCGPCLGAHMGVLAAGETCISAANRNFPGRMGSPDSEVYLASPMTVAASAVEGRLTDPRKFI